ncbi:P-loop containing nucleoside triphosphate hydrolase protein [Chaetomium tenue]|uniref:P-loop containing nucleoside triphosphate hydrolase protein n=1 Tax=Chaetomium tenue TaxID=1854479 RepID=A0ACB7PHP0_9PEZI|nr:P-loop containing nucleoside triphosphate hydrolase protein [Chaetomium globosum]
MPPKRFVPRERKRKVLDRQRAQQDASHIPEPDSNALEITPSQQADADRRKAQLRDELRPQGVKVSAQKAKRLEKYIDNKLKKDENRELLAKLAANKIDTSLFSSSKTLGQTKETKRDALRRTLREKDAGLGLEKSDTQLLYQVRKRARSEQPEDEESADSDDEDDNSPAAGAEDAGSDRPTPSGPVITGSGLKRPLKLDDSGHPVLAKRQKRGGVKTKHPVVTFTIEERSDSPEWDGFSDEDGSTSEHGPSVTSNGSIPPANHVGGRPEEDSSENNSGSGESDSDSGESNSSDDVESSEGDSESEDDDEVAEGGQERISAFKAWAHQQRNEAQGYKPVASDLTALGIPKPADFTPRPIEQDPLPIELQPTTNTTRKAYTVTVTRDAKIQEARYELPVVAEEQKIMEAIHNNDIVVVCGDTGSGKTTQLPQFLFEAGYGSPGGPTPGMIGVTQPRRVAAVSMSKRVARELGDHSHVVAYQIRFEKNASRDTAIKFMTDGILLRELAEDFTLQKYSVIILDEAHERSTNTDILIALLSRVVKLRAKLMEEDPSKKPLKVVIMSATLRVEEFTQNPKLFKTPPRLVQVDGRQHEVTLHFAKKTHHDYVEEAFRKTSRGHRKLPPGGMLVFLTGQEEIQRLSKRLNTAFSGGMTPAQEPKVRVSGSEVPIEAEDIDFGASDDRNGPDDYDEIEFGSDDEDDEKDFEIEDEESGTGPRRLHILPLYSLLPTKEQMRVFEPPPDGSRLVILATNVAETSLTIPGIRYVFDCGRSKERKYDPVSGVQRFEIDWISKASAHQRAGRAGRTGPGHCWRLYSSAVYERDFPQFSTPEILRTPAEAVVLQLKSMNLKHIVNFPFPTPPDQQSIVKAEKILTYISALSPERNITPVGLTMSRFPLAPRFARILLVGHLHGCLPYTIAMIAGLSAGEIFVSETQIFSAPTDTTEEYRTDQVVIAEYKQEKLRESYRAAHKKFCSLDAKSDAMKILQVVGEFAYEPTEQWCESHFVRFKALKEIMQLQGQLANLVKTHMTGFENFTLPPTLPRPSEEQVQALKQMVSAGFVDQVAIRADKAPNPPEMFRNPKRAIDVPYLPLIPLDSEGSADPADRLVYIHPSSPLARLSAAECPEYVTYAYLQRATPSGPATAAGKKPKTRMHSLTDLTGRELANIAKGTPLLTYGKPVKEIKGATDSTREVWVVPYLRSETGGGMGWPLPMRKIKQKRVAGKGWVDE